MEKGIFMIQPITQIQINKQIYFKNNATNNNVVAQNKHDNLIPLLQTSNEQRERTNMLLGILSFSMLAKLLLDLFTKNTKKHTAKDFSHLIENFKSLKDNAKIPTLENCKSVNKNLKEVLKHQVNQLKAGADVISETGEPQASNRLLLYGTPGTGKSFFSKIFAKSIDAEYIEIMNSDYNSMWAGEGVQNLRSIFEEILKKAKANPNQKYVVTFNEIDAMVAPVNNLSSSSKGSHWVSILEERSVFLNYLELLKEKVPNVTIIGTTNISPKNNGLDGAAMSRFQNLIEVPFPEKDCLYEALKMNLDKIKNKDKFIAENDAELQNLAQKMADRKFSFRNLEYIVNDAKGAHLDDKMNDKNVDFQFKYLKNAEEKLKLSDGELNKR